MFDETIGARSRLGRTRTGRTSLGQQVKVSAGWLIGIVGLLWGIELVNLLSGNALLQFGILPRHLIGLRGIIFAPLLHGSLGHLIANTVPFLVLGALVLAHGRDQFLKVTVFVALAGGGLLWVVGRPSIHVGASGLIFGYFGFLLAAAWFERHLLPVVLALAAAVLYGGVLFGLLPLTPGVSWEGHACGFAAGIIAAKLAAPTRRPGQWTDSLTGERTSDTI